MEDWKGELKAFLKRVSGKNRFQDIADDLGIRFKSLSAYFEKDSNAMPVDFVSIVAHRYKLSASDVEQLTDIACRSHSLFIDLKKLEEQRLMVLLHLSLLLSDMDDVTIRQFDDKIWKEFVSLLETRKIPDDATTNQPRGIERTTHKQLDVDGIKSEPVKTPVSESETKDVHDKPGDQDASPQKPFDYDDFRVESNGQVSMPFEKEVPYVVKAKDDVT